MKRKHLFYLMLVACTLFISCNNYDENGNTQPDSSVSFQPSIGTHTRATETSFDEGDQISVFAVQSNGNDSFGEIMEYGNYADNVPYVYENGKFIPVNEGIEIPTNSAGLYYHAIYPYDKSLSNKFNFSVSDYQDSDEGYTNSDLLTANTSATLDEVVKLRFSHRLSKLVLKLEGTGWKSSDIEISLTNVSRAAAIDLNALSFKSAGKNGNIAMHTNGTKSFKAILPPQEISKGSDFLYVRIDDKEYTVTASNDYEFVSGKQSTITLTFNEEEDVIVEFNGEIDPWEEETIELYTGIPSDNQAGTPPVVNNGEETFTMPNSISAMSVDPENKHIGRFNMAGINANGKWLELYGTGEAKQNVWLNINGREKGVKIINGENAGSGTKAKADIVFLVDNSGSMSEEANKIAAEIVRWSQKLSQTMDVKFGCVGIDHRYINGALDITDVQTLQQYLNCNTGTSRTEHYGEYMTNQPANMSRLKEAAKNYTNAGGECGGIMLHFADENFTFRSGSNRFYVYFTDEPNQPGGVNGYPWSVKTVDRTSQYYNWDSSKGVIYTVYSGLDLDGEPHNWTNWNYNEDPTLFSTYTGGQIIKTTGNFNISLDDLPVTGAITQSFIFTFNITPDLSVGGTYDITIIIYYSDGSIKSKFTYKGIKFTA